LCAGGCLDLDGLTSGAEYLLEVQSASELWGAGGSASTKGRAL